MSAANVLDQIHRCMATNGNVIADPGAGGTFNLYDCPFSGLATIASGTRKLPDNMPVGTIFYVYATGSVTITNASSVTVATLSAEQIGKFTAKTSTTWVAAVSAVGGTPASGVAISDSGSYTTMTNVETALQELYADRVVDAHLQRFTATNGAALSVFADNAASNPGYTILNSAHYAIRWNNNNNSTGIMSTVALPASSFSSASAALTLHVLASKSSNTSGAGENTTFGFSAVVEPTGQTYDEVSAFTGTTTAMNGQRPARSVQHVTMSNIFGGSLVDAGVSGLPCAVSFTLTPTQSTVNTDDLIMHRCWFTVGQ